MRDGVVVVGALHLDVVVTAPRLPAPDETLMGEAVALVCGGKGGNQAVAASRHGAPTAMLGRVGGDAFAAALVDNLRAAGVDTALIQRDDAAMSGLSVAVVGADGEYGAVVVSSANRQLSAQGFAMPQGARVLVLQNEVPETVNRAAAAEARRNGAAVVLNAAPMRPMAPELLALVDLLVVNRVEAEALFAITIQSPEDALEAATRAPRDFAGELIVTLGSDGLVHRDRRGKAQHHAARPVSVVSAHSAGDVFVGALAARMAASAAMEDAIADAQAAAARFVSTPLEERSLSFTGAGNARSRVRRM